MQTFRYKAKKENGTEYEGELEAESRFEVYDHIREEGGIAIVVRKGQSLNKKISMDAINEVISSVKESEKVIFTRNLAAMLDAGLSLSRSLSVVERQSKNPKLKKVMKLLVEDIQQGNTFHSALEKFPNVFSPLLISMVRVGEEGGRLPTALRTVSEQMEKSLKLKKKIQGAMIYPGVVITALIAIGIMMLLYVVPTLRETFEELGIDLPASTQFIIDLSNFLVNHTFVSIAAIIGAVVLFMAGLRTDRGTRIFQYIVLHIPIIGTINKEINAARTTRTLASLLSSGVEVVAAFGITHDVVQNVYYKDVLKQAKDKIQKGNPINELFGEHENLYPPLVGELVAVGEETGKLPDMLDQVASFYEGEVERKTQDMSTIVEPFLMVIVGIMVGFFAVSMITPIYSITEGI